MKRDAWLLILLFAALFVGALFLASPGVNNESTASTSFNADAKGVKAFYSLLTRLGYNADRLYKPYTHLPRALRVLVVVQPAPQSHWTEGSMSTESITDEEESALYEWIKGGGVALFISDGFKEIPPTFTASK